MTQTLYTPSENRIKSSNIFAFYNSIFKSNKTFNYPKLHQWSVENKNEFWKKIILDFKVQYSGELKPELHQDQFFPYQWFPHVKLNFAQNLLRYNQIDPTKTAIHLSHESQDRMVERSLTYNQLYLETAKLQSFIRQFVSKGDVVAAYMPNIPETVITMLSTAATGAIFTSTSCDFGVQGVIDRFGQTSPKVLVAATGYIYNGKYFDQTEKIKEIQKALPQLKQIILVDFLKCFKGELWEKTVLWSEIQSINKNVTECEFESVPFDSSLYIMYSSGTTGKPKCIIHTVGGVLLQHIKELGLHTDLKEDKTIFFFTTCGWMMWNWLVSSLYFGAKVVLFEGSPGYPTFNSFLKIIEKYQINIFGTSPKFLRALELSGEKLDINFSSVETILSTGSPLLPEQYDFVYQKMKSDILLASISGGTDIIGCFMLGNPALPVYKGEIQCLGLAMDVIAADENGMPVFNREGELVCRKTFPSCPKGFWEDDSGKKFREAYFEHFEGLWFHGDFITITDRGTVIVYGRSDATLNPGGVRIGTAEIYRQTEKINFIEDSLCVGKNENTDVSIYLFVKLKAGELLSEERIFEIKNIIRKNTTPRHVPFKVLQVKDIPYTRSGKKMELAITRILNNKPLTNLEAMANPDCLGEYQRYVDK